MSPIEDRYLAWQNKLANKKFFRRFWEFWGVYSVVFVFVAAIYFLALGDYKVVLLSFVSFILARAVFSPLVYAFYKKQRPYQKFKFTVFSSRLFSKLTGRENAFPSDHAVSFASVAAVMLHYSVLIGCLLWAVAFLNGWGRVVLGYHYVNDVLGGWAVGIFSAVLIILFLAPLVFTH